MQLQFRCQRKRLASDTNLRAKIMSQNASLNSGQNQHHFLSSSTFLKKLWSAKLLVALLMIIGFLLRAWGTRYGLPYLYHPDEFLIQNSLTMVKTNDLNPHFFGYGSLFFYINAIAYWIYFLVGKMIGLFNTVDDIPYFQMLGMAVGRAFMPSTLLIGRLVSVLLGTLCIPVAYWLGEQLSSRQVGLLSALFVTFSAPIVVHSQFATPNMLTTFLVLLALAIIVRSTSWQPYFAAILMGAVFGFAVASKYNAALLILPIGMTYFLQYGWQTIKKPYPYICMIVAGFSFLAVTPYAILDFSQFWPDTIFHLQYYRVNSHPGMEGNTVSFYLNYLFKQEGILVFLSLIPVIGYIKTRNRTGLILASFALPYTFYISTLAIRNDRTILITLPIFLIMAADALHLAWLWVRKNESPRFRQVSLALLTLFVLFSTTYIIYKTTETNIRKTTPDGREYARQWIETNIPTGSRIGIESYTPFIDPAQYHVNYMPQLADNPPEWYREQEYDLLIFSSGQYARFYIDPERYSEQVAKHETIWESFPELMQFDQNGVTIKVYQVTE